MKRILAATVLALGLLAATAPSARAIGCCGGCGPGYFNIGLNLSAQWGPGAPGGCCGGSPDHPAMFNAMQYTGYGYMPPFPIAGYGAPYGAHGYGAPHGYAGAPAYGAPAYGAPGGYAGAPAYGAPGATAGYGAAPAYAPASYGTPTGYGY
jgi:hypothetical protein